MVLGTYVGYIIGSSIKIVLVTPVGFTLGGSIVTFHVLEMDN